MYLVIMSNRRSPFRATSRPCLFSDGGKKRLQRRPNPTIFLKACKLLGVEAEDVVHASDDRRNNIWGARDVGCDAWLWGSNVHSFKENVAANGGRYTIKYTINKRKSIRSCAIVPISYTLYRQVRQLEEELEKERQRN